MKMPEGEYFGQSSEHTTEEDQEPTSEELKHINKTKVALGVLATGVAYGAIFGGFVESRSTGPMRGQAEFSLTPRGERVIERVVDTFDSAGDAITGIFKTAPGDNDDGIEFTINEGTPQPPSSEQGE